MSLSGSVVPCWSCGAARPADAPLCPACGKVQPVAPIKAGESRVSDKFAMLGFSRSFDLDDAKLPEQFRALSRKLHPDRFVKATPQERRFALEQGIQRQLRIEQQRVHLRARQHYRAIVIRQPRRVAHGSRERGKQTHNGDAHDHGGNQNFEEGEAVAGACATDHGVISGTPVTGSMRIVLCAPRALLSSMAIRGAVPPGINTNRRGSTPINFTPAGMSSLRA